MMSPRNFRAPGAAPVATPAAPPTSARGPGSARGGAILTASERIGTLYTPSAQGLSPRTVTKTAKGEAGDAGATMTPRATMATTAPRPEKASAASTASPRSSAINSAVLTAPPPPMASRWGAYSDGQDTSAGASLPLEWFDQTEYEDPARPASYYKG